MSCVQIFRSDGDGNAVESDYINANYVDGYHHEMDFICSQVSCIWTLSPFPAFEIAWRNMAGRDSDKAS
jgi:protein tyrosine phosphatase